VTEPKPSKPISLEDLIVLNDEIAALVRARVPLDQGLLAAGGDMPGRLGNLTTAVAVELSRGASLLDAIESEHAAIPETYRAVMAAGLRAGRLAAAAESVAGHLRRLAESRRQITASLVYPIFIVFLAWVVGSFLFGAFLPAIHWVVDDSGRGKSLLTEWLPTLAAAWIWLGAIPIVVTLLVLWCWYWSGRAAVGPGRRASFLVERIPWVGPMVRTSRLATFTEILAMLVENGVPLERSLVLAAEATGSDRTIRSARAIAQRLEQGEPLERRQLDASAIPPLLGWTIVSGARHQRLMGALRHAAETYRRRARHSAEMAQIFLPVLFTVFIGGTAVAISAFGLFIPYCTMLQELSRVW